MADDLRMALVELLRKAQGARDVDVLREGVRVLSQALMELEIAQHVGAERYERTGQRNGYRERVRDTRVGTVDLRVPRVRDGSFFPSLLDPRKRAERALVAVVQEAYVQGVSTRRGEGRPRLPWASAARPCWCQRASSRRRWRRKRPNSTAASVARRTPCWTRARTWTRCCSLWVKIIVSPVMLPG